MDTLRTRFATAAATAMIAFLLPLTPAVLAGGSADYIVVLKTAARSADAAATAQGHQYGVQARIVYSHAIQGYAARMDAGQVRALRADPSVDYVVADTMMHADTTETAAPWGLDRIDQHRL